MQLSPLELVTYENGEISEKEYVQVPRSVCEHPNHLGPRSDAFIMNWLRTNHGYGLNVFSRKQFYPKPSAKVLR